MHVGGRPFPDSPPSPPGPLEIVADSELALVAFREGQGPWQAAARIAADHYEATPQKPYTLLMVCLPPAGGSITKLLSDLPAPSRRTISLECGGPPGPILVRGIMAQPGEVHLGQASASSALPGWSFELPSFAGLQDLIAIGGDRVHVQRRLTISQDVTLPPIDLVQQGAALVELPVEVRAPPSGGTLSAATYLFSGSVYPVQIYRGPLPARQLPPRPGVSEPLVLEVQSQRRTDDVTRVWTTSRSLSGQPTPVVLWEPSVEVAMQPQGGAESATWPLLGGSRSFELAVRDEKGHRVTHHASEAYLERTSSQRLSLAVDAPGYLPAWSPDLAQPYTRSWQLARSGVVLGDTETFTFEQRMNQGPIISR